MGHLKHDCRSTGCKKCNLKHNTLLHEDRNPENDNRWNQTGNAAFPRNKLPNASVPPVPHTALTIAAEENGIQTNKNARQGQSGPTMCATSQSIIDNLPENESSFIDNFLDKELQDDTLTYTNFSSDQILLSTATVLIADCYGKWHKCSALLDSGSQSNLMTESLCKKLQLEREKVNIPLSGVNQAITKISQRVFTNISSRVEPFQASLSFLILPTISEKLPSFYFNKNVVKYPSNISLADEMFNTPKQIDLLLGVGIFYDLLKNGKLILGENMPILKETRLGWIFAGKIALYNDSYQTSICNLSSRITNKELNETLNKFWTIEELPTETFLSKEEQSCEDVFKTTTTRDQDGRFIVSYPFKENIESKLGDSKSAALRRFKNLEKRFDKNHELKEQYVDFMTEYETLGHMHFKNNLENDSSLSESSYFLPHTAVLRDSITTKCRVVFDASAKTSTNISFNDLILVGPTIQSDLFSILLRLRLRKFVLSADIKMMYRCILINPKERSFQQILWRKNHEEPIKVYQLRTVTYGTSSAPFQATRCLKQIAIENQQKYPRTAALIENSFYMDDLLLSLDTEQEAVEIYHELTEILSQCDFQLRKWSSNEKSILNYISENSDSNDEKLILCHNEKELKTLGIVWNANQDILKYSIHVNIGEKITKRTVLSAVSQIFDPLGLVGPAIIQAKLLMQELWQLQIEWDQDIPENIKRRFLDFMSEIDYLNQIKINRHVLLPETKGTELFGFCDSSEKAYGACIYLSSSDKNGKREVRLLTAMSKVAPIKKQSLPRLELLAAHLLAELVNKVKNILNMEITKTVYFTDSTIVLAWLKIEPCKLKTFVANRVAKILDISDECNWKHVRSQENAADIISRGLGPRDLYENDVWFNGPEFLYNEPQIQENCDNLNIPEFDTLPDIKTNMITLKSTDATNTIEFNIFQKYSTYYKLRKIVAYICRFKNRTLKKIPVKTNSLSVQELNEASVLLIRLAQRESFRQDISDLENSKPIHRDSTVLSLNPFLDSDKILRVGGRILNSNVDFSQRHQIILPHKHKLTDLIILDYHLKYLHAGSQNLLSLIRLQFWPIKGKNTVKRIINSCIICYRAKPKTTKFMMGSLPGSRVNPSRPFSNCGVDYAGPIYVKEGTLRRCKTVKTYICIFVCFTTRAVHIELVPDLTTDGFLNALKRFCARRGKPSNIHSDNGLNFVGANNYFLELYNLINDQKHNETVATFLANDQINWHFIPARSAHMGGLWEAAVKSTKFHLKRVLGNASLDFANMYTLLVQIEACLNSRPLTPISNDVKDYDPLTPSHFLIGDSLASSPEADFTQVKSTRLSLYQRLQQLHQQFWDRWSREYLTSLQTRSKWKQNNYENLKLGALVVLVEDNQPPLRWPMARIVALHPGVDQIVRVVSVRLPNGNVTKRSVAKVCLLPIETEQCE